MLEVVDMDVTPQQAAEGKTPAGVRVLPMSDGTGNIAIRRRSVLSGEMLLDSQATFDANSRPPLHRNLANCPNPYCSDRRFFA